MAKDERQGEQQQHRRPERLDPEKHARQTDHFDPGRNHLQQTVGEPLDPLSRLLVCPFQNVLGGPVLEGGQVEACGVLEDFSLHPPGELVTQPQSAIARDGVAQHDHQRCRARQQDPQAESRRLECLRVDRLLDRIDQDSHDHDRNRSEDRGQDPGRRHRQAKLAAGAPRPGERVGDRPPKRPATESGSELATQPHASLQLPELQSAARPNRNRRRQGSWLAPWRSAPG